MIEEIKKVCRAYNIWPQRSKGQNFLINREVLNDIIIAASLKPSDVVLEVGPGLGILTEALVKKVKKIISVELDKKLFSFLQAKFVEAKNLQLVNQDVLRIKNYESRIKDYKIVANIPYNITSVFLRKFLTNEPKPSMMVLLIQKEVAEIICARPGKMSLLSVSIQLYGQPEIIKIIPKQNFWPQPEVDSAILKISKIISQKEIEKKLSPISEKYFWQIVKMGFSAKRKMLVNNLAGGLRISNLEVRKVFAPLKIDQKIRAQDLNLEDWFNLARSLKIYSN